MRNHSINSTRESNFHESLADDSQQVVVKVAEMSLRLANLKFYHAAVNGDVKNLNYLDSQAEEAGLEVIDALHTAKKPISTQDTDI